MGLTDELQAFGAEYWGNVGNESKLKEYYHENATYLGLGVKEPAIGRDAIMKAMEAGMAEMGSDDPGMEEKKLVGEGDFAFQSGKWKKGCYMYVYKKTGGKWQIYTEVWTKS